jgi:hypothetical protein
MVQILSVVADIENDTCKISPNAYINEENTRYHATGCFKFEAIQLRTPFPTSPGHRWMTRKIMSPNYDFEGQAARKQTTMAAFSHFFFNLFLIMIKIHTAEPPTKHSASTILFFSIYLKYPKTTYFGWIIITVAMTNDAAEALTSKAPDGKNPPCNASSIHTRLQQPHTQQLHTLWYPWRGHGHAEVLHGSGES